MATGHISSSQAHGAKLIVSSIGERVAMALWLSSHWEDGTLQELRSASPTASQDEDPE